MFWSLFCLPRFVKAEQQEEEEEEEACQYRGGRERQLDNWKSKEGGERGAFRLDGGREMTDQKLLSLPTETLSSMRRWMRSVHLRYQERGGGEGRCVYRDQISMVGSLLKCV